MLTLLSATRVSPRTAFLVGTAMFFCFSVKPGFAAGDMRLPQAAMQRDMATVSSLLQAGVDPDTRGDFDTPALHWLVRVNETALTKALLDAGADPNSLTDLGISALSIAIANGNAEITRMLLAYGAKPNVPEPSGETLLMSAAAVGEPEVLSALLASGVDVNELDPDYGQTALMFASRAGKVQAVKLLLEHGADPNIQTKTGPTPAFVGPNSVPGFGFGVGIIRGGVPADRGRREPIAGGMSALHYAARHNQPEVAKLLLDAGAELNTREANDIWPLLMAISTDSMEVAHFLLEQPGVLINAQDWYGRSPIWEAVNVRNLYVHNSTFQNYIEREPVLTFIKALLAKNPDVNVRTKETPPFRHYLLVITGSLEWVDFTGQTPFLTAALAGDTTVMHLLLEHGADPLITTFEGTNALMAAAGVNWVVAQTWTESEAQLLEAVKLCFELGMDVNHANSMGLTALHGAANRGSNDIIEFLAEKGADLTALDKENRSALDWAKGVFLATHPEEAKPESIALLTSLLQAQGKPVR